MLPGVRVIAGFGPVGKIVGELKKFIFGRLQLHGCVIRDAKHLKGIMVNASLHVLVMDAADLNLPGYEFVSGGIRIIREISYRDLDTDQLGFVISVFVKLCFQLGIHLGFQHADDEPVAKPVKQQYE
jgi:hypothetical protein